MKGWDTRFHKLVRQADPEAITLLSIQSSVPIKPWKTTQITLLGDAIHSMTPMRGIGANTALRDSELLFQNLKLAHQGKLSLYEAVHSYESEMIQYGFEAVRASMKTAEQSTADNAFGLKMMKTTFKLLNAVPPLKSIVFRNFGKE
nr:FAD-dependent monooxygenase [Paenibacillus mangrovi]